MNPFKVVSSFTLSSDQEKAVRLLSEGIEKKYHYQTLLGVTGSGKTYSMAKIIEAIQKPALILTHNKTLAAQLYREFRDFFPQNMVEYFVSYYDYYQPEAYVVSSDMYIEKDASVNDEIDRLRLKATSSILERRDVIVVASVSCIYGLGTPEEFEKSHLRLSIGSKIDRDEIIHKLVSIYYERNNIDFSRGKFRVKGDSIDIYPAYLQKEAYRIDFFDDTIETITRINPIDNRIVNRLETCYIYPAKHFISSPENMSQTLQMIENELNVQLEYFKQKGKLVEAQRLESRTRYDMEMLQEMGYCNGIENYSRILSRRKAGERPACLLDYFPDDFITIIDESHVTIPQLRGMYMGDRSRKETLVEYGFRLPSALDNRPLYLKEFNDICKIQIFVSATPGDYEDENSLQIAEQVIRPTGLLDPVIIIRPAVNQVDDLINEIHLRVEKHERTLVTTLTKKMAEDLTKYFTEIGIKARYLHSEISTIDRVEIIHDLRRGEFDCLIGINLLREGLDIPEVSLVAILDADKEGFLRSTRSLIQTSGRAARNLNGTVIMYADTMTESIKFAVEETNRRRGIQEAYNITHNIKPSSIKKKIQEIIERDYQQKNQDVSMIAENKYKYKTNNINELERIQEELKKNMLECADKLEFEKAAVFRDQLMDIDNKIRLLKKIPHTREGFNGAKNSKKRH